MTRLAEPKLVEKLVGLQSVNNIPLIPYHPLVCDFLNELSILLRNDPEAKKYSDVMTFAFWCRESHLHALKKKYEDGYARLGLGLAFHIAPSNIPINFAFSFVLSVLAGNANVVRVPSKKFPQVDLVCHAIAAVLNHEKYSLLKNKNSFVRYERDDEVTQHYLMMADARVIWGGDETIAHLRQFKTPMHSIELSFPDRYSFCVINADAIVNFAPDALEKLAQYFYHDTYLVDQNACSSPHLIIWLGEPVTNAQTLFWNNVLALVQKRYIVAPITAIDKYTQCCSDAITFPSMKIQQSQHQLYRIQLDTLPDTIDHLRGIAGYFYEYQTKTLDDLCKVVTRKCQTLTYFGIPKEMLLEFVIQNNLAGIDRIVPIGQALEMDVVWDGVDVVKRLSRIVSI